MPYLSTPKHIAQYSPNQKVQVYFDGRWRDAIILRTKIYPRDTYVGYEYQFDPYPVTDKGTGVSPSGWASENVIRLR